MQKSIEAWLYNKQWRIQVREGPGHTGLLPSPLIFRPNWGPKGRDKNLETRSPYSQRLDDRQTEIGNRARKVSGTQGIFAPKSHRNACFASYRGTDYVQQKKQYNQSIKPPGELYCLVPLRSFVMTVPTERRNKLLWWNLYDYKKATQGDWFLPTYFWRFAI